MSTEALSSFHLGSFVLSRVAFLLTHVDVAYWINFLLNDPLKTGLTNTLDIRPENALPEGRCRAIIQSNIWFNICVFVGVWWAQHSVMARKAYKQALGLWHHPVERPIYAVCATVAWFVTLYTWRPISDCASSAWDPLTTHPVIAAGALVVWVLAVGLVLGLLYSLPTHVFGTGHYRYQQGNFPTHAEPMTKFPYGLVRHPAAAGFLWMYWSLPSYTVNHLLLASMWTIFIVAGTRFEEGGLKGPDEFGVKYAQYSKNVWAYVPTPFAIRQTFFGKPKKASQKAH